MLSAVNARNSFQLTSVSNKVNSYRSFGNALSSAIASSNLSTADTAQISATAKAQANRPASPQFNNSYFERLGTMTNADMAVLVGKDADALSASQGLPSGQYDFTSLTTGQTWLVTYNLKNNLGTPYDAIVAFDTNIPTNCDDDTVYNMVEPIKNSAKYEKEAGNAGTADWLRAALTMMATFSADKALDGPYGLYNSVSQSK